MSDEHTASDEILDTSTGEVRRREVPFGDPCPEPSDLHDPVPFPFPGNDPTQPEVHLGEARQPDHYDHVPDPDGGRATLARSGRDQKGLAGLSADQLVQAGYSRDEAHRIAARGPAAGPSVPGPAADGDSSLAAGRMDPQLDDAPYVPPTDDEIHAAARWGVSGPLEPLYAQWRDCQACPLAQTRLQVVLGSGNPAARYVFVGQAPGPKEDQEGGPFVGPAGEELTSILNAVEINRAAECYLMNTVCCRPIDPVTGRVCPPSVEEMRACRPRFAEQLKILVSQKTVKVIVLLGKEAYLDFFYKTEIEKGTLNPNSFRVRPKLGWQDLRRRGVPDDFPKVYFTYHPSYILRNGGANSPEYLAWKQDFMAIKRWGADSLYTKPRGQEILV